MRESSVASSILPESLLKPGAKTEITQGIKNSINSTKIPTKKARAEMALAANTTACFLSSQTSFCDSVFLFF